jgi:nicotinate-nucleotide adenylyltransferase
MTRRVAVYGGSFDPVHVCHVLTATYTICRAGVDELRVIPAWQHPFGKTLSPFDLRCEMLELAMDHLRPMVRIDPIEASLGDTSYTVDTVRAILAQEPEAAITLVVGTDVFSQSAQWKDWDQLVTLVDFFVVGRGDEPDPPGHTIQARLPDVSSSSVRALVAQDLPIGGMVSPGVAALIDTHRLYRVNHP